MNRKIYEAVKWFIRIAVEDIAREAVHMAGCFVYEEINNIISRNKKEEELDEEE